jgi:prepilin-type N-terminal cleavage/methylation domain-containing protein
MQKFWQKNKKHLASNSRGLTLIEMVLAIAVLSITILASTAVSATYLNGRIKIKKYQANNEELSMALNFMSKDIRMSNELASATTIGSPITLISIKSNVNSNDIVYQFATVAGVNVLQRTEAGGTPTTITSGVTGSFYVLGDPAITIPRITIRIQKETSGISPVSVQTTVSMRSGYEPATP